MQMSRQTVISYETEITSNIWVSKALPLSKPISRSWGILGIKEKDG